LQAIQERRRSALTTPDTFFGGHAPGIGARPSSSAFPSPIKLASPFKTPFKNGIAENWDKAGNGSGENAGEEAEEDTKALLERMKETVEGMKRRRSEVPRAFIPSPVKVVEGNAVDVDREEEEEAEASDKENEHGYEPEAHVSPTTPQVTSPTKRPHLNLHHLPNPRAAPKTPQMDGMRDLFREKKIMRTPAFEGVGEMMKMPEGWTAGRVDEEGEEDGEEVEEVAPVKNIVSRRGRSTPASSSSVTKPPSSTSTSRTTSMRRKTPRSTTTKTPVTEGRSNFADDEATPLGRVDEEDEDKRSGKGKKPVGAGSRGRSKVSGDSDAEEGSSEKASGKKARLIRGSRKVVDDIPEVCAYFNA